MRNELEQKLWNEIIAIELKTKKLTNSLFFGNSRSIFKGNGLDFKEHKIYESGDEFKYIDWRVSSRKQQLYIKEFEEEKEINIALLIDISSSSSFGSKVLKKEIYTKISAIIAFSALKSSYNISLILFDQDIVKYIPFGKGKKKVFTILKTLVEKTYEQTKLKKTNLNKPLEFINKLSKSKALIFLISDFLCEFNYENNLKLINSKHDLISLFISAKTDFELPNIGLVKFNDPETNQKTIINTGNKRVLKSVNQELKNLKNKIENIFIQNKINYLHLNDGEDFINKFIKNISY